MEKEHDNEFDPAETTPDLGGDPVPVDPEDAEEAGFIGGSGGPASIIYGDGDDDEADEHGDRLLRGPDESL
jgi:hypothetical protein